MSLIILSDTLKFVSCKIIYFPKISCDPRNPILCINSRKLKSVSQRDTCAHMFTAQINMVIKKKKQLKYQWVIGSMNKYGAYK